MLTDYHGVIRGQGQLNYVSNSIQNVFFLFPDWVIGVANAKKIYKKNNLFAEVLLMVLPERATSIRFLKKNRGVA